MALEMPPQSLIDHVFKNKSIIDGIVLRHIGTLVPTGRSTAGYGGIHDIICHQEEGLEPLHLPTENGSVLVLLFGEFTALEDLHAFDDGEASGHLAPRDRVGEARGVVFGELAFEFVREAGEGLDVRQEVGFDLFVDGEEGGLVGGHVAV